jgi:hypothetical protein
LSWNEGNTFEVRDISQAPSSTQQAFFINKSGFRQIRPAWKNLTVSQDYGTRLNFYEGQFSKADCGSGTTFTPTGLWSVTGTMALLNPYKALAANPLETVFLPIQSGEDINAAMTYTYHAPSMAKAIKMAVKCSNSAWRAGSALRGGVWAQRKIVTGQSQGQNVSHYYYLRYCFNIFATVGSTKYVLRETWIEYDPLTIEQQYLYFVMPGSEGGIDEDNEVTFYIADLPGAADIEFVVYPVIAQLTQDGDAISVSSGNYGRLTDITFTVCEAIGGRDKLIAINAEHNIKGNLSFGLSRVPDGCGNALLFLGGLYYSNADHSPIQDAALTSGGTEYDLLELVAREHIAFNNDNYNLLSGAMKASAAFSFGKGILFEGTAYRLISASLNLLSNTLQVQAMQTEPQFPTASYVITDVDEEGGSASGGYSGASVPQGGFGGVDWFISETYEVDGETRRRLKLNPAYTGMYAEGWITAGGLGSDSGGTGGSLATLADVALGTLAAGDILQYNATTSHWVNVQPTLALLTDVALGTPTDGQALIWDATLGKWRPGTVASTGGIASVGLTMPEGFSVAGSPLTSDGTLAVTYSHGYSLPATADVNKGVTAYGWGNHASAGYMLASDFTAANIVSTLNRTAVNRAWSDAHGDTIASQTWVGQQGFLTSVAFGDLTSHPTTLSGYGITDAYISGGTITLGNNSLTPITSLAFSDLTSHPTTLAGYGITDAKISRGTITLGSNTITPLTSVAVSSAGAEIGTSLTVIGTVEGVEIKAKIASYLLSADFTAANIVSTLGNTAVNRAIADGSGNSFGTSYLRKDTDDTMAAHLTVGTSGSRKTLTLYGSTSAALTIYGSSYYTDIYRNSSGLQLSSNIVVDGNITASGNIIAGSASDRRLKRDIKAMDINAASGVLEALRPVQFTWNEKARELGGFSGDSRGFLADEYNDIIPNATRKIWGEYDAIDYIQTIPYLVAGWQAQNLRIRILEGEIRGLKGDNEMMRRRLREHNVLL